MRIVTAIAAALSLSLALAFVTAVVVLLPEWAVPAVTAIFGGN